MVPYVAEGATKAGADPGTKEIAARLFVIPNPDADAARAAARRMIAAGKMTPAGQAALPDLSLDAFTIAPDILAALQADPQLWDNFQNFPGLYQRIRISYIESARKQPDEFQKRLQKFLSMTRQNKTFGGSME